MPSELFGFGFEKLVELLFEEFDFTPLRLKRLNVIGFSNGNFVILGVGEDSGHFRVVASRNGIRFVIVTAGTANGHGGECTRCDIDAIVAFISAGLWWGGGVVVPNAGAEEQPSAARWVSPSGPRRSAASCSATN